MVFVVFVVSFEHFMTFRRTVTYTRSSRDMRHPVIHRQYGPVRPCQRQTVPFLRACVSVTHAQGRTQDFLKGEAEIFSMYNGQ